MNNDNDNTQSFVPLMVGTMVSHYKILSKIGAGGMGEVYLAEDSQLDRKVALKFLPSHLSQDKDSRTRFTREAKAAAKLDHPNIVQVFEVGEFNGRPFFAMAHIEGQSLRGVIKDGKLSVSEAVEYTKQICEGLLKAHEAGVVHRDIKPANIIIDQENRPRLLDFGLATVTGEEKLTKTGSTLGTVGYMAPEQITGKTVDHRADLFSVGVILYEMLTGHKPFEGDNDAAVVNAITNSSPEPIARFKSGVTGELQQIVDKALSKDPSLRYQHADGMLSDLKRLEVGSGATRKNRFGVWAAVALIVIVAGYLIYQQFEPIDMVSDQAERIMLAVLPFENLGNPDDAYFADGITEEITSRLGMIRELGVISRTSAMHYKGTDKSLPQIAKELGVDYILGGTVRWDKRGDTDFVRITPELIEASDNTHIWTNIYHEELTDVFGVQGSISSDIAAALDVALVESVRKAMDMRPTDNKEAYTAYLRALEYDRKPGNNSENIDRAILMFQQAIEHDSGFALAWAGLSFNHLLRFGIFGKQSKRLADAREAANRSLDLAPNLAEGHLALGFYYSLNQQLDSALSEFDLAQKYRPSLARTYNCRAVVLENIYGFTDESLSQALRGVSLDPLDGPLLTDVATVYFFRRELDKTVEFMDKAIAIAPDEPAGYALKAMFLYLSGVDLEAARELFEHPVVEDVVWSKYALEVEIADRNYDLALEMLARLDHDMPRQAYHFKRRRAWITWLKGDSTTARLIYDSLRVDIEGWVKNEDRSNELRYVELAECYAILDRKEEAIKSVFKALEYVSGTLIPTLDRKQDLARIYALVGEPDKAIDELENLLSVYHSLGVPALKVHPDWDPLRDHPRFKALIEKYDHDN